MDTNELTDTIQNRIYLIRDRKVMLERDLAKLSDTIYKQIRESMGLDIVMRKNLEVLLYG